MPCLWTETKNIALPLPFLPDKALPYITWFGLDEAGVLCIFEALHNGNHMGFSI